MRRRSVCQALSALALTIAPVSASGQTPTTSTAPPPAYSVGAAYDSAADRLVVFGGYLSGQYVGDTWEWDGTRWTRGEGAGPRARNSPALVYDARRGRVLLFGGDARPVGVMGDTWERVRGQWRQLDIAGPPARTTHVMVYDARRDRVVLFGGVAGDSGLGDTWEFDGERWRQVASDGPPARGLYAMEYDPIRGRTVLFGGTPAPRPDAPSFGDTWEWDGQRWTRMDVSGPSPRDHAQMGWDPARRLIVLHGGGLDSAATETWLYNGQAWTRAPAPGPQRRYAKMMADTRRGQLLLYGGFSRMPSNELWRFGPSGWERLAP